MSDKRKELEALAQTHIQRSGLRDLSFRRLAEQSGVKSSSVHYYFPEKNDLTAALITSYTQAFIQRLHLIDSSLPTLRSKLTAFIDIFEQVAADEKLCLCGMLAAELSTLDDDCRGLLRLFFEQSENWLADLLTRHQNQLSRERTGELPAARLAAVMMSGLEGALLLDRIHGPARYLPAQRQLLMSFVTAAAS